MRALDTERILGFGQLRIDRRRVWHCENAGFCRALESPSQLRRYVREEPFRPLPTRADLPKGWHVKLDQPGDAHAVIETVYPGLVADWAARRSNDGAAGGNRDAATWHVPRYSQIAAAAYRAGD